ncbi:MAG TPA: BatA domain-containing protein [Chitinophagales bacterium]|nr:BatA domain-containing protein [Chitinophagales bacterium]
MSFLYPAFLFALAAISIPIIIHLFNFRRYKTVYFSNTKFLKEVKEQTDSRSRIKHLLVLLCRILAITFLVFAFAQPYIKHGGATETAGRKTVSIFLDNSFSMGQTQSDVPLLEIAKKKAGEIVSASNDDDLFQLLTNDFEGKQQRLIDKQEMLNEIKDVQLSPVTRTLDEVIMRQREAIVKGSGTKLGYVISDFQKSFADVSQVKADSTIRLSFVPLHSREAANVYIDTCWFESPEQVAGQAAKLLVRIVNHSNETRENGRLTLKINDQIKAISDFTADPNGIASDTITYNVSDKGWNRAELSIIDHPITFDDTYYFSYLVAQSLNVMVINEATGSQYLNALFSRDSFFVLKNVPFNQLNYADLFKNQFVIINSVKQLSSGLTSQLKTFLEQGGSVCMFPDLAADLSSYNLFLSGVNADLISSFENAPKQVTTVNTHDPLFRNVFQHFSQNITLPKCSGSFSFPKKTLTNAEPLLTCNDGSSLITKYQVGKGLLYVAAVPLDKDVSDLPLNAVFAPMMYNMAIVHTSANANAYIIGNEGKAMVNVDLGSDEQVLRLKGNNTEFFPAQRKSGSSVIVFFDNSITRSGFYALEDPTGATSAWFAMNYNRQESDLTFLSNDELQKVSSPLKVKVITNTERDLGVFVTGQKLGIPLWKVSILFVLLFIAFEIALLKFWK